MKKLLLLGITLLVAGCVGFNQPDPDEFKAPSVSSVNADVSGVPAKISGSIQAGSATVQSCTIYWSKQAGVDISTAQRIDATLSGNNFSASLPVSYYGETIYYVVVISNGRNNVTSQEKSFKVKNLEDYISVAKPEIVSKSGQNTITVKSSVTSTSGAPITEKGIHISTDPDMASSQEYVIGIGVGDMQQVINDLTFGLQYYVRAYAKDRTYVVFSEIVPVQVNTTPEVTTSAVTAITSTSATCGGNVTYDGGTAVTARGVVWSTSPSPTVDLSTKTVDGDGTGSFTSSITGLKRATKYYVRAYATNAVGTVYGELKSFTTLAESPEVTTSSVTNITSNSASCGGNVTSDGGANVTVRGVVWSTSPNPTIELPTKNYNGSGTGSFTSSIVGLKRATTYYVRAYATNTMGTVYGEEMSFTTLAESAVVTTSTVSSITSTSASCGGNVTSDGGATVTARGVVWSTSPNPTVALSTKTSDGSGTGSFTSSITGLKRATKYYVRAYATNAIGTVYGEEKSFTTLAESAEVTTSSVSSITSTSASCGGNVTSDGGATVTSRGVVWSTSPNPTTALSTKTVDGTGTGSFTSSITSLQRATKYYVRAYATNAMGTVYGEESFFWTLAEPAEVATSSVTNITSTSASCGGNVTSDGGATVTSRGVVWSTSPNPTIALQTKTVDGTGTGSFTSSITGLKRATKYYVRAFANNKMGTVYGEEMSFTTLAESAEVTTSSVASITNTSASCGGNVTSDGGATVTSRGVVWGTSPNPTVALSTKTSDGTGTGSYISSITGLKRATKYYVRAYATNAVGTVYGEEKSFTTLAESAEVTSSSVSSITSTSASCGGNVTSDGGATVTARGVVWSTSPNPTVALSTKTSDGTGTGSFTSSITGLKRATKYYVRAYATNAIGTVYGEEKSFTTLAESPEVTTSSMTNITSNSASCGGNVTSDGGATVTARGVVWSTSPNPTTALSTKTVDGTGTGSFTSSITSLKAGTTYYIRAYATNSMGTVYGEQKSFTTKATGNNEGVGTGGDYNW